MKFTPTTFFTMLVNATGKYLQWKVFIKKTTDLSEALDTGTWTEVTDRIPEIPTQKSTLELEVGSSTSDNITLVGMGIEWWEANIFNASASQYLELKIEARLGLSEARMATDIVYSFYGYIDKAYKPNEFEDTVEFGVYTADDLLSKISAENLTQQFINQDVDGAGLDGLFLPNIPGVYVVKADVTSYVLKQGVHTISFEYNAGTERAKLDDGNWVTLTPGLQYLYNDAADDQRIIVYNDPSLWITSGTAEQEIVVLTYGDVLPRTWYAIRVYNFLKKIYSMIGINNFVFDEFTLNTFDARKTKSFFEMPPGDGTFYGKVGCIAYHNASGLLYLGVGDRLYSRNMTTGEYTLLGTPEAGYSINRLWIEPIDVHGCIVGIISNGVLTDGVYKAFKYNVTTHAFSVVTISAKSIYTITYVTVGTCEYQLLYTNVILTKIYKCDIATMVESSFNSALGTVYSYGTYAAYSDGTYYYSTGCLQATPTTVGIIRVATGSDSLRVTLAGGTGFDSIFIESLAEVFFRNPTNGHVYTFDGTNLSDFGAVAACSFAKYTTDKCCFINNDDGTIKIVKGSGTLVYNDEDINYLKDNILSPQHLTYDVTNDRYIFCFEGSNVIGQYHDVIAMFINPDASFEGQSLRDVLNEILTAYMLVGIISSIKKAYVYRRFDDSGNAITSGQSIAITINEAEDITSEKLYSRAVDWLEVSNGAETHSYDGSIWDQKLNTPGRTMSISSSIIPSNIIKDVCYYLWQYFHVDHHKYVFPLGNVMPLHAEVFDRADVAFSTTKIKKTASAPIYDLSIEQDGAMEVGVVI